MLLAIDTSTAQVGMALYDGTQVLGEMTWSTRQHHTTELAPALSGLLNRSAVSMDMLSALAVAIGPGSFTSLRVGLSLVVRMATAGGAESGEMAVPARTLTTAWFPQAIVGVSAPDRSNPLRAPHRESTEHPGFRREFDVATALPICDELHHGLRVHGAQSAAGVPCFC